MKEEEQSYLKVCLNYSRGSPNPSELQKEKKIHSKVKKYNEKLVKVETEKTHTSLELELEPLFFLYLCRLRVENYIFVQCL